MTLRHLLRMGPAEMSCRARQEISKWIDRRLAPLPSGPELPAGATLTLPVPGFFPGVLDDRTSAFVTQRMPEARQRTLAIAAAVLKNRFDLLGYRGLFFGEPVDWHLDPVSGHRAPRVHWSRLDPLDAEVVGDSKVIWELNRHQWFVRLGQAYRLTGDDRFAEAFARSIADWIEGNPRGIGINWASSLEVAFRVLAWSWALHLFRDSKAITPMLQARILGSLWCHAAHVERYLSYYFSPNTHLTGEALGLLYAGVLLRSLPRAGRWRRLGTRILERESRRQILPDGIYFEQSTCYQRYTAEIYVHFLLLAERSGIRVPPEVRDRVGRLLDALLVLLRPDGSLPQIGDSDGGRLLPLEVRGPEDVRDVFSTAAVLFRRPEYAWAAGGLAPETLWFLGPGAAELFDTLRPAPPADTPSRALAHGGYVVMRTSWAPDADQVIFDTGPLGCPVSSGHGHADLLGIQCTFRGRPYVVDPGTFRYTADQGWRSYFRSTAAHSTVEVDGIGQATPRDPFGWDSRPEARLLHWEPGETLDFAEAEHTAYHRLPDPVTHRRKVLLVKAGYCVVVDDLHGAEEHRVDLRFQFAPMQVTLESTLWARAQPRTTAALLIRAFSTTSLKATVLEGETEPRQGWISCQYGRHEPAPLLVYSTTTRLPLRIITLLWPTADPSAPPPAVTLLGEESDAPLGLLFRDGGDALYVDRPELIAKAL